MLNSTAINENTISQAENEAKTAWKMAKVLKLLDSKDEEITDEIDEIIFGGDTWLVASSYTVHEVERTYGEIRTFKFDTDSDNPSEWTVKVVKTNVDQVPRDWHLRHNMVTYTR